MRNYLYLKVLFTFFTTFGFNSAENSDYDNCGIKYGCFGNPSNCVESKSCTILVTFAQKAVNGDVDFNLIASDMANRYLQKILIFITYFIIQSVSKHRYFV